MVWRFYVGEWLERDIEGELEEYFIFRDYNYYGVYRRFRGRCCFYFGLIRFIFRKGILGFFVYRCGKMGWE